MRPCESPPIDPDSATAKFFIPSHLLRPGQYLLCCILTSCSRIAQEKLKKRPRLLENARDDRPDNLVRNFSINLSVPSCPAGNERDQLDAYRRCSLGWLRCNPSKSMSAGTRRRPVLNVTILNELVETLFQLGSINIQITQLIKQVDHGLQSSPRCSPATLVPVATGHLSHLAPEKQGPPQTRSVSHAATWHKSCGSCQRMLG